MRGLLLLFLLVLLCGVRIAAAGSVDAPHQTTAPRPATTPVAVGPPLRHGPTAGPPTVYLTFDDGPEPAYTPQVLALLADYGVKATFFVIGSKVREHPELAREVAAGGHSVQNHTLSHSDLTRLTATGMAAEIGEGARAIRDTTGRAPRCLRPPYGYLDAPTLRRTRAMGVQLVLWDLDPRDWARPGTDRIVRRVLAAVHPGAIVLLHDGGKNRGQTVAALRLLLPGLVRQGYRFAALCR